MSSSSSSSRKSRDVPVKETKERRVKAKSASPQPVAVTPKMKKIIRARSTTPSQSTIAEWETEGAAAAVPMDTIQAKKKKYKSTSDMDGQGSDRALIRRSGSRERDKRSRASTPESVMSAHSQLSRSSSMQSSVPSSTKKTMLKYMIHEVRELKRAIDPNAPDIHVHQKRRGHGDLSSESGSEMDVEVGSVESLEEFKPHEKVREQSKHITTKTTEPGGRTVEKTYSKKEKYIIKGLSSGDDMSPSTHKRRLPHVPHKGGLNQTYPPPALGGLNVHGSFNESMLKTTPIQPAVYRLAGRSVSPRVKAFTPEEKRHMLNVLKK